MGDRHPSGATPINGVCNGGYGAVPDAPTGDWADDNTMANPQAEIQYRAKDSGRGVLLPTKEKRVDRMGRCWVRNTEGQRADTTAVLRATEGAVSPHPKGPEGGLPSCPGTWLRPKDPVGPPIDSAIKTTTLGQMPYTRLQEPT